MIKQFNKIDFSHLPHEENHMVDALATLASMFQVNLSDEVQPIHMGLQETSTHYSYIEKEVDERPWYYDIQHFIKDQQYLEHAFENEKRILRILATRFLLDGEIVYEKGKYQVLLRCVDAFVAKHIIEKVYRGICGRHANSPL